MISQPSVKAGCRLLGIGTDIVYLPRFSRLLQKYRLSSAAEPGKFIKIARKFMHPYEIAKMQSLASGASRNEHTIKYIAGIWATKESIFKAFSSFVPALEMPSAQCIYTKLIYKDKRSSGQPILQFDERFPANASPSELSFYHRYVKKPNTRPIVSISHDKDYLVAVVCLVECEGDEDGQLRENNPIPGSSSNS